MKYKLKKEISLILLLVIILNLPLIFSQETTPLLQKVLSFEIPSSLPDNLTQYDMTTNFEINDNTVHVETKIVYFNVLFSFFNSTYQVDDKSKVIYNVKILKNNLDTVQPPMPPLSFNGCKYVANFKSFPINKSDIVTVNFDIANAITPTKFSIFNLSLSKFFYPFDSYSLKLFESPDYLNKKEKVIILNGKYKVVENQTFVSCPSRVRGYKDFSLISNKTNQTLDLSFTTSIVYDNDKKFCVINKQGEDKTIITCEQIKASQGDLVDKYLENQSCYLMNESNSCFMSLKYTSQLPVYLILVSVLIIIISSFVSAKSCYDSDQDKTKQFLEKSLLYFILPLLIGNYCLGHPLSLTLLDILLIVSYLLISLFWFYFFKWKGKRS